MPPVSGYRGDLAYIHDVGYGHVARDAAARLIRELTGAGLLAGTVVDVGCGSGILAQALTGAGYDVVGIDSSEAMVALARARVPGAEFRVGSFAATPLPASVAVAAVGEVLCYAFDPANDERGRADWFGRAYDALQPGGVLLFDQAGPGRLPPQGARRTFTTGPDWAVLVETSYEEATAILVRTIVTFRRVGTLYRRDEEVHRLVLVEPAATLASLRSIGFEAEIIQAYGSVPLPPGVVAFLARKPVTAAA
jgi:SAM-dependent methyltransferase